MYLEKIVKTFCSSNNLIYGVTNTKKLDFDLTLLEDVPFVNFSTDERVTPSLTMADAKSVIIIGVPYLKNKINSFDKDYHIVVSEILNDFIDILDKNKVVAKAFVDTGALFERGFALASGLGFKARNTSVINEEFGSYFNIGYIMINKELTETYTYDEDKSCLGCDKCISSCPTKSLKTVGKHYNCDYRTCLSYISQKKGELTLEEIKNFKGSIYGCEVCQQVCPHNSEVEFSDGATNINLVELLDMSNRDFIKYKDRPFYWRGLSTMKRNALVLIYNSEIDVDEKIEIIKRFEKSDSELLKVTLKQLLALLQ